MNRLYENINKLIISSAIQQFSNSAIQQFSNSQSDIKQQVTIHFERLKTMLLASLRYNERRKNTQDYLMYEELNNSWCNYSN
jgi:hypothetical protein